MGKQTFEDAMKRLESIVEKLESETELEKSIALYEEGVKLSKHLNSQLNDYTRKIEIISNGEIKPFDIQEED